MTCNSLAKPETWNRNVSLREASDASCRYEDWVKTFLRSCGPKCANVHLLPVFDLTATRHDAHHGNFGRGRDSWVLDCRHFCTGVVDVWNQVMYNLLC